MGEIFTHRKLRYWWELGKYSNKYPAVSQQGDTVMLLGYWVIGLLLWLEPSKWFRIIDNKQDKHDEFSLQNTNMSDIK